MSEAIIINPPQSVRIHYLKPIIFLSSKNLLKLDRVIDSQKTHYSVQMKNCDGRHASSPYELHFLAVPAYKPLLHTIERTSVCELYLFPHKTQIFKSNNKKYDWDYNIKPREPLGV